MGYAGAKVGIVAIGGDVQHGRYAEGEAERPAGGETEKNLEEMGFANFV